MTNQLRTMTIHNKTCYIYKKDSGNGEIKEARRLPIFYWGVGEESRDSVEAVVSELERRLPDARFLLAAYETGNWNDDFSPWAAPAVFGKESFGGKAADTLKWLTEYCIPYVEAGESEIARFSVGYSLAGLFSLWVYCECRLFAGAVSCSGSLWYAGWLDYVKEKIPVILGDGTDHLYLSLGDKEEKTKNRLMATVGDNTRKVYALFCGDQENRKGVLEWNQGGHFSEPDLRIVKGIDWILQHFVV